MSYQQNLLIHRLLLMVCIVTCSGTVAPRYHVTHCPIVQHQATKWLVTPAIDSKSHVIC